MTIHVNGRERELPSRYKSLTHDEIVILAFGPPSPDSVFTITYRFRAAKETGSGSIAKGDTLKLRRGLVINCVQTNKG